MVDWHNPFAQSIWDWRVWGVDGQPHPTIIGPDPALPDVCMTPTLAFIV